MTIMTISSPKSVSLTDNKTDENPVTLSQTQEEHSPQTTKRSIWSSIQLKATLAAIAIGVMPVSAIGATAYYFANQSITTQISQAEQKRAAEVLDKINRFIFERYGDIQIIASLDVLTDAKTRASKTLAEKQAILARFEQFYKVYDSIVVFDLNGDVLISSGGKPFKNHKNRIYFQEVLKNDRPFISQPLISTTSGTFNVYFSAPVKDAQTGKTIGIVRSRMPVKFLDQVLANLKESGEQQYYLFNNAKEVFVGPKGVYATQTNSAGKAASASKADLTAVSIQSVFPDLQQIATIQAENAIAANKDSNKEQLIGLASTKKLADMPQLNWGAIIATDTDVAFSPQQQLLFTLLIGTGITALLVAAIAAYLARLATRPILNASEAVEKLGQGDLDTRIDAKGDDELAQLGGNINQMASRIKALLNEAGASDNRIELQNQMLAESEALQTDVGHILDIVSAIEDGDLTVEAEVSDRATGLVSDTLNRLIEQFGQVLAQVQVTSQQVSTRSTDLEELAKTVASNAASQAQEAQKVLSLTNQVQDSASSSAKEIDVTNQSLLNMTSTVEQGRSELNAMNQGISDLQQGTDRIVQQMKTLGEFVGLAEQFVQDQSQIASLTQVLALNATLVAARASEQKDPRKFMVVAREFEAIATQVGNLAQQTNSGLEALQQRTSQINAVVSGVDAEVQGLGSLVNGFTKGVAQSSQVFSNVQTIAGDAVQAGTAVTKSNQEIIAAAQATAQAMRDISVLADRTARLTQTTREQSEQMGNLSDQLLKNVQFFRLPESMLQAQEGVQRVDLSQAQEDTVVIEPFDEDSTHLELANASESVLSRSL
jgi:methyl-accepting chemotaxis protein PixJ